MLGPHQSPIILHELISQIPLFWIYEKFIHAYIKSREIENYLKTRVELKMFERIEFLKFI